MGGSESKPEETESDPGTPLVNLEDNRSGDTHYKSQLADKTLIEVSNQKF